MDWNVNTWAFLWLRNLLIYGWFSIFSLNIHPLTMKFYLCGNLKHNQIWRNLTWFCWRSPLCAKGSNNGCILGYIIPCWRHLHAVPSRAVKMDWPDWPGLTHRAIHWKQVGLGLIHILLGWNFLGSAQPNVKLPDHQAYSGQFKN